MSNIAKPHFIAYDCATCGAKPRERCRSCRRLPTAFHADRIWKGIADGWRDDGR